MCEFEVFEQNSTSLSIWVAEFCYRVTHQEHYGQQNYVIGNVCMDIRWFSLLFPAKFVEISKSIDQPWHWAVKTCYSESVGGL